MKKLALAALFLPVLAWAGAEWSSLLNKDNVEIYKRQLKTDTEPEIKGVGNIATTQEKALAFVTDIPKYGKLIKGVKTAEVLKTGTNELYAYFYIDFPWPAADRDYSVHYQWEVKDNKTIIKWKDANYWRPDVPKGVARIEKIRGSWVFEDNTDGTIKATYTFLADYGGDLPDWIKKDAHTGEPLELFKALRKGLK
jgi:Polyketide cyclase / dehydrase and lipid transport